MWLIAYMWGVLVSLVVIGLVFMRLEDRKSKKSP